MRFWFLVGLLLAGCASNRSEPPPPEPPPSHLDAAWQALRLHHVVHCANPAASEIAVHDAVMWELEHKLVEVRAANGDPEPTAGQIVALFRLWCPEWDDWL